MHRMISPRFVVAVFIAALLATAGLVFAHVSPGKHAPASYPVAVPKVTQLPPLMLWAWERPEDLSAIDPNTTGVAFLARTVFLAEDTVSVRPRLQPLRLAPGTQLVAVVRIEASHGASPSLSTTQIDSAAHAVAAAGQLPGLAGLQIDFDATASQRDFYRALIARVRQEIPARLSFSITALASWCTGDDWLHDLPIDDAVAMLFRMGAGTREISLRLNSGGDFRASVCRQSLGISTDELPPKLPEGRRLYIFNPHAWTPGAEQLATQMVRP
jgi:Protein of unknown function (DUF3142)